MTTAQNVTIKEVSYVVHREEIGAFPAPVPLDQPTDSGLPSILPAPTGPGQAKPDQPTKTGATICRIASVATVWSIMLGRATR
ncbi:hypothetical protein NA56DRAFT_644030 [Hyaloscypha hepaticicola]|jgi:hypothetical protein|uniref:Uncharacterized protein n=1 Tax=Hyaloscypha hepaticicola TaxID=2082293 RepID=A0A2J6QA43_9HELO|nr:hypothetical protein NA56DRAFT_644030 [Hyaloscypha hepaticicola]